jgi:hypothetical protein
MGSARGLFQQRGKAHFLGGFFQRSVELADGLKKFVAGGVMSGEAGWVRAEWPTDIPAIVCALDVPDWNIKSWVSSRSRMKEKSSGNRSGFRPTALFRLKVLTP